MKSNILKQLVDLKTEKSPIGNLLVFENISDTLKKIDIDEDYIKEGKIEIEEANEVVFYNCELDNFIEKRKIEVETKPNYFGVQFGKKQSGDFDIWKYKIDYELLFKNSENEHEIEESHFATGCSICNQNGNLTCDSCYGEGANTCSNCSGRGEIRCSSCSGSGEVMCWSCWGKGTKETGYGNDKRIERCTSCSGRGKKPCRSCRNGYINCSTCGSTGKETCFSCKGQGKVTCYNCDGCKTLDNYFVVESSFVNESKNLFVTKPLSGFDVKLAEKLNFNIKTKEFDLIEQKFVNQFWKEISDFLFINQFKAFFDYADTNISRLISSRLTLYQNKYLEVKFLFHNEHFVIYFDKDFNNFYFSGQKPTDKYETQILSSIISNTISLNFDKSKKLLDIFAKHQFINIEIDDLKNSLNDTENILNASNNYILKKYSKSEYYIKQLSDGKKSEKDFKILRTKLYGTYFSNMLLFSILPIFLSLFIIFLSFNKQFFLSQLWVSLALISIGLITAFFAKNIWVSRFFIVISVFTIQGFTIFKSIQNNYFQIIKENLLILEYNKFLLNKKVAFDGTDSIVIVKEIGNSITQPNQNIELEVIKKNINDFKFYKFYKITVDSKNFQNYNSGWTKILNPKNIKSSDFSTLSSSNEGNFENREIESSTSETNSELQVGTHYQGGTIIKLDETNKHGLIISNEDLGTGNWFHAVELCDIYTFENYNDWRLPSIDELQIIYSKKNVISNFADNWYWSSTENPENIKQAFHLGFISGDEMSVPKEHGKYVRAIRNF